MNRVRGDRVWGSRRIYCASRPKKQTYAIPIKGEGVYRCLLCGKEVKVVT